MTEAERFLREKLNPSKQAATSSSASRPSRTQEDEAGCAWGVLHAPVFAEHRKFWFMGFILLLILANLLLGVNRGDLDDLDTLCFLLVTPITFWIPALFLLGWSFGRRVRKIVGWIATVWMVCAQLFLLFVLFDSCDIRPPEIAIGIVVALLGSLGIAAVIRNLIVMKVRGTKPLA